MEELSDIKRANLIRLAKERRVDEPARLARTLGVSIQHASQLLLGKANIVDKTVQRLCAIWNIDPAEFVLRGEPNNTNLRNSIQQGTASIIDINRRIGNIRADMSDAAKSGDITLLGGDAVNDK